MVKISSEQRRSTANAIIQVLIDDVNPDKKKLTDFERGFISGASWSLRLLRYISRQEISLIKTGLKAHLYKKK